MFGRNATGGAINIIPNLPTDELKYGFDASVGADPTLVRSSAYTSGPFNDDGTLRGRLAVQQTITAASPAISRRPGRAISTIQNNVSSRGQLEWLPTPDFTARLSSEYQREDSNGPAFFLLGTPDPNQPSPVQIQGAPRGDPSDFSGYENYGVRKLDAKTVLLTTDWRIGGGNLKAVYSYPPACAPALWGTALRLRRRPAVQLRRRCQLLRRAPLPGHPGRDQLPAGAGAGAGAGDPDPTINTRYYADFAHAQYRITPRLRVFTGLRYSHDYKSIDDFNNFIGSLSQAKSWSRGRTAGSAG